MEGQGQAITNRPPHGANTTHERRTVSLPVSFGSTAATASVPGASTNNVAEWVTFECDVECFIRFGATSDMAPATSSDWPMHSGREYTWWIRPGDCYFRVIAIGPGVLKYRRSS